MSDVKYKAEGKVKVSSRLNVRQGNGTSTSIIGKLTNGTAVKISHKTSDSKFNDNGTMRGGYKIEYKGGTGYVCTKYVTITKEYADEEKPKQEDPPKDEVKPGQESNDTYILTGSVEIVPNLDLRVGNTVNMQGLGKYISGLYFIEEIEYSIDRSGGMTQTLSVSKNAFGESVNSKPKNTSSSTTNTTNNTSATQEQPQQVTPPKEETRTHTFKKGDTLWGLAVKYYGSGTKWTHIAKANGIDVNDDKRIRSIQVGEVFKIPYL